MFEQRITTVEAWQWNGAPETAELICDWIETNGGYAAPHPYENVILLGDSVAPAKPGEWIVRDKFNEFWPLDDGIFPAVYRSLVG